MPDAQDDLAPGKKDPVEGARGPDRGGEPAGDKSGTDGGHLGPGGDPAEGKSPSGAKS